MARVCERDCGAKLTLLASCLIAPLLFGGAAAASVGASCKAERGGVAVSGRVLYASAVHGNRLVTAFNGTQRFTARPDEAGNYCVRVAGSTRGTHIALFATALAGVPQAGDVVVTKGRQPTMKANDIRVPNAPLKAGFVIGVAYIRIVSGRPTNNFGIGSYDGRLPLRLTGSRAVSSATSALGVYRLPLPPGRYTLRTRRNVVVRGITVKVGLTTILPVFSGETIVF